MIKADWAPSDRKLRQFSAALVIVAIIVALRRASDAWLIGIIALALTGLLWPAVIRPVYLAVTLISQPLGWLLSHVLLRVIYYLVLTPVAAVFRIGGRDSLRLRRPDAATYWEPFAQGDDLESYFRQT